MISAIFGICLLLIVTADVVMSTLGVGANGPLAPRVARGTFHIIRFFPKQDWVHRTCGPLVVVSIGAAWIVLICLSWTLILSGSTGSVVSPASDAPTNMVEKAIYAGHLLSTPGGGNCESSGLLWGDCFGSNWHFRDGCADLVGFFCLFHDSSCFCRTGHSSVVRYSSAGHRPVQPGSLAAVRDACRADQGDTLRALL